MLRWPVGGELIIICERGFGTIVCMKECCNRKSHEIVSYIEILPSICVVVVDHTGFNTA